MKLETEITNSILMISTVNSATGKEVRQESRLIIIKLLQSSKCFRFSHFVTVQQVQ